MKYTGKVRADCLLSDSAFNFIDKQNTENGDIVFEVEDDMALAVAEEMSINFKPGANIAVVKNEYDTLVAFPNKIFRFTPKEPERRQKALDYAKTLSIPEAKIDF